MAGVGCADNSATAPLNTPALRGNLSVTAARRGPTRFANRIKYRDQGKKNARGFAGSASLEARALLGMDGNTTLDVATGTIDNPDLSRLLKQVQVKQYAPNGTLQTTTNYKDLSSPTYQATLAGRVRGSKLGVQGIISAADGKVSNVVSVTETVKLRPDVSVDRIVAPTQAAPGTPVEISAVISENNGDVGARTDCVLAVDGVDVGRANGIWVDAGRSVSCVFDHTFTTSGTKQLTARAISVNPGDWNTSNNTASQSITIYARNEFSWGGSYIALTDWVGTRLMEGFYIQTDNGARTDYRQYEEIRRRDSWQTGVEAYVAYMAPPLIFSLRDRIDGQLLTDFQFDESSANRFEFTSTFEDPNLGAVTQHGDCVYAYKLQDIIYEGVSATVSPAYVQVCSDTFRDATGAITGSFTRFQYGTSAGDVSYYTEDYQKYDDGDPNTNYDYEYSFNGDVDYTYGSVIFGNDYSFVFTLSGPDGTRTGSGTIPTTTYHNVFSWPYSCEDFDVGSFTGRTCSSADYRQTSTSGVAYGNPDSP
ncbi:MAG TPA: hypothetical protein VJ825_07385 [Gemmatimonadaceae bacterium]|nr:hypothetical protein [Gemmatimonadaceae bacterium]